MAKTLDVRALIREQWVQFLVVCGVLTVAYYASLGVPMVRAAWYTLIGLLAVGAIVHSINRKRTANPWAWVWIALGVLLYFAGDVTYNFYRFALDIPRPFPSVADAFFLLSRVPLIIGLVLITRQAGGRHSAYSLLDTLIVASGLGLLWWAFLMAPHAYNPSFNPLERFIAVAYPAADFLLLATAIRLAFSSAKRTPPSIMLGAALAALLTADVLYAILQLNQIYQVGTWLDLGWILFYALIGAVALYPKADIKPIPPNLSQRRLAFRLGLLTLAALLLPLTIAISRLTPATLDWATIGIGTILVVLVMLRQQRLMQQNYALQKENALWKSDMLFKSIINRAFSGVSVLQADMTITYANPKMHKLTDLSDEQTNLRELIHPEDLPQFELFWQDTLKPEPRMPGIEYRIRDGTGVWRDVGSSSNNLISDEWIHGVVLITQDISARKHYERELKKMAYSDTLTGLPNRAALSERLEEQVKTAAADRVIAAAIFIDLDNFKDINDSLGHTVGDRVLKELSSRLQKRLYGDSMVARFGGDEFVIVPGLLLSPADAAVTFHERFERVFDRPIHVEPYHLHISASAGIALSINGEVPADELLDNAAVALHNAKQHGQGSVRTFTRELLTRSRRRHELTTALHDILTTPQHNSANLLLHLEPIVSIKNGEMRGAEVIPSWIHEQFGRVHQQELSEIAYEADLLAELESRTLDQACSHLKAWLPHLQKRRFRLHVNISAASLQKPNYDKIVLETLKSHGVPPSRLALEISETTLASDAGTAIATLGPLADHDVIILVDNFGRTHSSFNLIRDLPHSSLKFHGSITSTIDEPGTSIMTEGIISIAHKLGRSIIADGIDTPDQAARLRKLGCDLGQGHVYGDPMSPQALADKLEAATDKSGGATRVPS